jgi:hypothetical protein
VLCRGLITSASHMSGHAAELRGQVGGSRKLTRIKWVSRALELDYRLGTLGTRYTYVLCKMHLCSSARRDNSSNRPSPRPLPRILQLQLPHLPASLCRLGPRQSNARVSCYPVSGQTAILHVYVYRACSKHSCMEPCLLQLAYCCSCKGSARRPGP